MKFSIVESAIHHQRPAGVVAVAHRIAALVAVVLLAGIAPSAEAGVIVDAFETESDGVVFIGAGSLNREGLMFRNGTGRAQVTGDEAVSVGGTGSGGDPVDTDELFNLQSFSGPSAFGTVSSTIIATTASGDIFGIRFGDDPFLIVPDGYADDAALTGQADYATQTFETLGLTPGTSYTWTWESSTGIADSFTLNIIPEPSTAALTALGLAGLAARRRRA